LSIVVIVFAVIFGVESIDSARASHIDWGTYWLTVPVLAVATATLIVTLPRPARVIVQRQDELGLDDLIFMLVTHNAQQVPRDYLLQLHVAVINVGGRKAVLSTLQLTQFWDDAGHPVQVPDIPMPLTAQMARQSATYVGNVPVVSVDLVPGPYVLEPDDVITLRFRSRRGIDWQPAWTLGRIQELAAGLARPVKSCTIRAVYRRGHKVEIRDFKIAVLTQQQDVYADALGTLTNVFTQLPQALPLQSLAFRLE
jgi:hypothetical protein